MADLIDRKKIKARIEPWLKVTDYSEGELNMLKAVLYEITIMPSAQPDVPDTNVGDMISRQAVINAIENTECELTPAAWDEITDVIIALPSADVQPVQHGRWIKHDVVKMLYDGRTLDGFVTCNKCQSVYALEAMEWAYCPMCGSHNWEGQYN